MRYIISIMLFIVAYKKRSRAIRERRQLKMGIKSQAFSFCDFEKAYLCCIKIDNSLTNHTFLVKKNRFSRQKKLVKINGRGIV